MDVATESRFPESYAANAGDHVETSVLPRILRKSSLNAGPAGAVRLIGSYRSLPCVAPAWLVTHKVLLPGAPKNEPSPPFARSGLESDWSVDGWPDA